MPLDLLGALITSKTRIKLLLKFFLNPDTSAYLRSLEEEFGESSNGIRLELNRLQNANMLVSTNKGNRKYFKVNQEHPLYEDVNRIVRKYIGLDVIIERITDRLGSLSKVYLVGDLAKGMDSQILDLLFVGEVDKRYLLELVDKTEKLINRKIRYVVFSDAEFGQAKESKFEKLLLWSSGNQ